MLTSTKVTTDIYAMLKASPLAENISGNVYHRGQRPRNSGLEDAVITFTAGTVGEVEEGVVTVNVFINDIDPYDNGIFVMDGVRATEVEHLAGEWVDSLTADRSNYLFSLQNTIYVEAEPSINQHFVVIRLAYRYYNNRNTNI